MFSKHMHFEFKNDNKFLDITDLEDARGKKNNIRKREKHWRGNIWNCVYIYITRKLHVSNIHTISACCEIRKKQKNNDKHKSEKKRKKDNIERIYKSLVRHDNSLNATSSHFER